MNLQSEFKLVFKVYFFIDLYVKPVYYLGLLTASACVGCRSLKTEFTLIGHWFAAE